MQNARIWLIVGARESQILHKTTNKSKTITKNKTDIKSKTDNESQTKTKSNSKTDRKTMVKSRLGVWLKICAAWLRP